MTFKYLNIKDLRRFLNIDIYIKKCYNMFNLEQKKRNSLHRGVPTSNSTKNIIPYLYITFNDFHKAFWTSFRTGNSLQVVRFGSFFVSKNT